MYILKQLIIHNMQKDKFSETGSLLALLSLGIMVISAIPSTYLKDIRWFSMGVMCFGIFYFGFMGLFFGRRVSDIADGLFTLIFSSIAIFVFFYGIALFLWHYDNNILIDYYIKFGVKLVHFVDGIIQI